MPPRIAIPVPTSFDPEYNDRSWPQYARAVERAGGIPVPIPLHDTPATTARLIDSCTGVLLPGSGADVNPQKYGQPLHPAAAPPDPARENVDELLLQDAHNMGKPLLAICFGTQILNVWRGGSLIQDIESALPTRPVLHKAGRTVAEAHTVDIAPQSLLAHLLQSSTTLQTSTTPQTSTHSSEGRHSGATLQNLSIPPASNPNEGPHPEAEPQNPTISPNPGLSEGRHSGAQLQNLSIPPASEPTLADPFLHVAVNSSHHQAIESPGDGLFIAARSSQDGIIEAIEGGHGLSGRDHAFLLGVQWHPERTFDESPLSRAIFHHLVTEAAAWTPRPVTASIG